MTKICRACNTEKELDSFRKNNHYKDGRDIRCKSCVKEIQRIKREYNSSNIVIPSESLCLKCNQVKASGDFYKNLLRATGLSQWCKECTKEYGKSQEHKGRYLKYYSNNRDAKLPKFKNNNKTRRTRNRAFLNEYLSEHQCAHCGESRIETLEFHHTDSSTKVGNVSSIATRGSLEALTLEVSKCIVLCANCHRLETARINNWYQ